MSGITHPRTLIRRSIRDRLKQGTEVGGETFYPTPAGELVLAPRDTPTPENSPPLIMVYADEETTQGEYFQDEPKRVLTVSILCRAWASTEEALDDLLDEMELAVYFVVMADRHQGGHAQGTNYLSTAKERNHKGNVFYGDAVVKFQVDYSLPEPSADELDDFLKFHADYDLVTPDENIDATDEVTLPGPE